MQAGIVGGGTMGIRIAHGFIRTGNDAVLIEPMPPSCPEIVASVVTTTRVSRRR